MKIWAAVWLTSVFSLSSWAGLGLPMRGICAHQGANRVHRGNTVDAVLEAAKMGAQMVEFDVRQCKTGELVISHDPIVGTKTGKRKIDEMTFDDLRSLTLRSNKKTYRMPTFDEMIDPLPKDNLWINIHCYCPDAMMGGVAKLVKAKGRLHQAFLTARMRRLKLAREAVPEILLCNIERPGPRDRDWTSDENEKFAQDTIKNGFNFLQLCRPWPKAYSEKVHAAGVRVCYFKSEDPAELKGLYEHGIDFILTNNLEEMLSENERIASEVGVTDDDSGCVMRFGVASDVHLLCGWRDGNCRDLDRQAHYLEKALRWFDLLKADAVVFPGDMAHTGRIAELELLASVWDRVFPDCHAADGRRVERMLVTGNHEVGQWPDLWKGYGVEELQRIRFDSDLAHMRTTWKRLFHEDYELMWRRTVKGITFIGCQFPGQPPHNPQIGEGIRELARDVPKDLPFFYVQHAHPAHSCYCEAGGAVEEEESNAALSRFPNAVALSGHSHNSLCDERSVWQGAYTSIGCGSLAEAGPCYGNVRYDNGGAPYASDYAQQRMKCPPQVGNDGRCCLFIEVYRDHLVVKRHSLAFDESLGDDWVLPVPVRSNGAYGFERRHYYSEAPQFPVDAKMAVEICKSDPVNVGPGLKGKPCVRVSFPRAKAIGGSRVFDYVIKVFDGGREVLRSYVLDPDYYLPESRAHADGECILGAQELPRGRPLLLTVEPRNCFGKTGSSLAFTWEMKGI